MQRSAAVPIDHGGERGDEDQNAVISERAMKGSEMGSGQGNQKFGRFERSDGSLGGRSRDLLLGAVPSLLTISMEVVANELP